MRLFRTILIVVILVGLPVISWLYLKSGKDWRQKSMSELKDKTEVPQTNCASEKAGISSELFQEKVSLLVDINQNNSRNFHKILSQFVGNTSSQFLLFAPQEHQYIFDMYANLTNVYGFAYTDGDACQSFVSEILPESENSDAALIDVDGMIRHTYSVLDTADMNLLVKHFAILLPMEKRDKVELRRDTQQRRGEGGQ